MIRSTALARVPMWVRVADVAMAMLAVIGISVLVFGGFRETLPIGRVSVTSPARPFFAAVFLLLVRHIAFRQPNVIARVASAWSSVRATDAWRATWPVFISTRIGVLLIGFFGISIIGYAPNTPPWRVYENDFLNLPARWDTGWYVGIAERGYQWTEAARNGMQNIAFFPGYPVASYYLSLLMGRQTVWAGVVISFVAFFGALHYLFRFARDRVGEEQAGDAVMWIAVYPFALFFSTAYSESLFLLCALATCYHFERDQRWQAALWGLAAGLSRPNGCLLSIVLALIAVRSLKTSPVSTMAARIAVAAMPGVGMLIFAAYIYSLTGNPLEWAANHAAYGREYRGVAAVITERIDYISLNGLYNYITVLALDLINFIPIVFAITVILPVYRLLGLPYAVMIAINVLLPVLMGGVLSMGRITSVMFPLFIWLAVAVPPARRVPLVVAFSMAQALFAVAFFTWRPLV